MNTPLALALLLSVSACTSATTKGASGAAREPSQDKSFDAMPLCARLKYAYAGQGRRLNELPPKFARDAVIESKRMWQGAEMMKRDTRGRCAAFGIRDLIEKPERCDGPDWSGPYVESDVYATYQTMTPGDFASFLNCWLD